MSKIIVIFSGGLDSTTVLYWAKKYFDEIYAITFDYGQKNKIEIDFAKIIAKKVGVKEHRIFKIDLSQIGGSALINKGMDIPKNRSIEEILGSGVAPTYVPLRNAIFITIASAWAETLGIENIAIGVHRIDTSGYPDTTPQFIESIENMLNTGSKMAVEGKKLKIYTPLIDLDKAGIIKLGLSLGADYSYSISCYAGNEIPCGKCDACILRKRAFEKLGLEDPLIVRLKKEGKI